MSELPYSLEAEQDYLGIMMIYTSWMKWGLPYVEIIPDDFYDWRHRIIYVAMLKLTGKGIDAWEGEVKKELDRNGMLRRVGGRKYIHSLVGNIFNKDRIYWDLLQYALIVKDYAMRRTQILTAQKLAQEAFDYSKPLYEVVHD